jgi:hypothetical protein
MHALLVSIKKLFWRRRQKKIVHAFAKVYYCRTIFDVLHFPKGDGNTVRSAKRRVLAILSEVREEATTMPSRPTTLAEPEIKAVCIADFESVKSICVGF